MWPLAQLTPISSSRRMFSIDTFIGDSRANTFVLSLSSNIFLPLTSKLGATVVTGCRLCGNGEILCHLGMRGDSSLFTR